MGFIDRTVSRPFAGRLLAHIQQLVVRNEELKQQELKYKEQCRAEMAQLEQEIG